MTIENLADPRKRCVVKREGDMYWEAMPATPEVAALMKKPGPYYCWKNAWRLVTPTKKET